MAKQKQNEKPAVRTGEAVRILADANQKTVALVMQCETMIGFINDPRLDIDQIRRAATVLSDVVAATRLAMGMDNDD